MRRFLIVLLPRGEQPHRAPRRPTRPSGTLRREIRAQLVARAPVGCQACGVRTSLEVHHVVKCAQGGSDFDLDRLVALCPACHAQTDAPYARGRLTITPLGDGRFKVEVTQGAEKWATHA